MNICALPTSPSPRGKEGAHLLRVSPQKNNSRPRKETRNSFGSKPGKKTNPSGDGHGGELGHKDRGRGSIQVNFQVPQIPSADQIPFLRKEQALGS